MPRILLALLLALVTTTAATAQNATQKAQQEAKQYLATCPSEPKDRKEYCLFQQKEFVWDYVSAKSGDYEDQQNVAYMLQHGADGAVTINMVQSCAWYLYSTSTGNPRTGRSDLIVAGEVCNTLNSEAEHLLAATRAARIASDIRLSPARKLPPLRDPS